MEPAQCRRRRVSRETVNSWGSQATVMSRSNQGIAECSPGKWMTVTGRSNQGMAKYSPEKRTTVTDRSNQAMVVNSPGSQTAVTSRSNQVMTAASRESRAAVTSRSNQVMAVNSLATVVSSRMTVIGQKSRMMEAIRLRSREKQMRMMASLGARTVPGKRPGSRRILLMRCRSRFPAMIFRDP